MRSILAILLLSCLTCFGQLGVEQPFLYGTIEEVGLILRLDSTNFDAASHASNITNWLDSSGRTNDFTYASQYPLVDQVRTVNGHASIRFDGYAGAPHATGKRFVCSTLFIPSNCSGLDVLCVFRHDFDPSKTGGFEGPVFMFNAGLTNTSSHQPYTDGIFYENFGVSSRVTLGNPTTATTNVFVLYEVAVRGNGAKLDAWINNENFYSTNSNYTFSRRGQESGYYIGWGGPGANNGDYFFQGNLAALRVYGHYLTDDERTASRAELTSIYGAP